MQHAARLHTAWCLFCHDTAALLHAHRYRALLPVYNQIISWSRQAADAKQDVLRKPGVLAGSIGCDAPDLEDKMQLAAIRNIPNQNYCNGRF